MQKIRELPQTSYTPHYLGLKGGGMKGFAYVGVMKALEDLGKRKELRAECGSSAGALIATGFALGFTSQEVEQLLNNFKPEFIRKSNSRNPLRLAKNLVKSHSLYDDSMLNPWIERIFTDHGLEASMTFEDLHNLVLAGAKRDGGYQYCDLTIFVTDLDNRESLRFDVIHTPKIRIADALRFSVSITRFFPSCYVELDVTGQLKRDDEGKVIYSTKRQNDYQIELTDGGVLNNYPVDTWDTGCKRNDVLGFHLAYPAKKKSAWKRPVNYVAKFVKTLQIGTETVGEEFRTVFIPAVEGLDTTSFDATEEQKQQAILNGYEATIAFFEAKAELEKTTIKDHSSMASVLRDKRHGMKKALTRDSLQAAHLSDEAKLTLEFSDDEKSAKKAAECYFLHPGSDKVQLLESEDHHTFQLSCSISDAQLLNKHRKWLDKQQVEYRSPLQSNVSSQVDFGQKTLERLAIK